MKDIAYIKNKLSLLPLEPGCYLMKDDNGTVIYVGKAKKLKSRVSSYFTGAHNYKTTKLVEEINDFEYIVTSSEKEALLLEINLIKDFSPRYNIMFMDNSYYPYIQITKETHPRLKIVRDAKNKKCKHFGPFPDATAARETYKLLNRLYPLRKCESLPNKPCLYYSLHQCIAPCINKIDKETYAEMISDISKFIKGDTKEIMTDLENKMIDASENLQFEQAKEYRDLMRHIDSVTSKQKVQLADQVDRDVIGYYVDKGYISIQVFFMRDGKLLSRDINLMPIYDEIEDVLISFIHQFYQTNTIPKEILIPKGIDAGALEEILDCRIVKPEKGDKEKLVQLACNNAKELLEHKFLMLEKSDNATVNAFTELADKLNMKSVHRVELFDNSNIQGAHAVAGMVVFIDGKPAKNEYRKYKIQTVEGPNDYESMKEVVYRRYFRVLRDNLPRPDLIIVDGGTPQINAAKEIIDALGLGITICGLSKDDKHSTAMLLRDDGEMVDLDRKSQLFYLLTRMQDEVHRYAISFHKNVRSKSLFDSILDQITGVGEKRKKALLRHFGSVKQMREASIEQLSEVVPKDVAIQLYNVFRKEEEDES